MEQSYISPYLLQQTGSFEAQHDYLNQNSQNTTFQDDDNDNAGQSSTSSGKLKRKIDAESAESRNNKKRFVWPEALHKDFVAAVFDVGLRSASPKSILDLLPRSDLLTTEHIKSHLQKFRVHRERSREDFLTHYEMSVQTGRLSLNPNIIIPRNNTRASYEGMVSSTMSSSTSVGGDNQMPNDELLSSTSIVNHNPGSLNMDNKERNKAVAAMLRRQFELVSSTISLQSTFLDTLKSSILSQTKVKVDLAQKIVQLDPTIPVNTLIEPELLPDQTTTSSPSNSSSVNQTRYSLPLGATAANSTALLMANEMQSLKHVHSFLHKTKNTQMAQFVSSHTTGGGISGGGGGSGGGVRNSSSMGANSGFMQDSELYLHAQSSGASSSGFGKQDPGAFPMSRSFSGNNMSSIGHMLSSSSSAAAAAGVTGKDSSMVTDITLNDDDMELFDFLMESSAHSFGNYADAYGVGEAVSMGVSEDPYQSLATLDRAAAGNGNINGSSDCDATGAMTGPIQGHAQRLLIGSDSTNDLKHERDHEHEHEHEQSSTSAAVPILASTSSASTASASVMGAGNTMPS